MVRKLIELFTLTPAQRWMRGQRAMRPLDKFGEPIHRPFLRDPHSAQYSYLHRMWRQS